MRHDRGARFRRTLAPVALVAVAALSGLPAHAVGAGTTRLSAAAVHLTEVSLDALTEINMNSVNVLGIHTHDGEWMLGYEFMFMRMEGNRDGTDDLSDRDVLRDFMVAPTDMAMEMHMFHLMYAPTGDLTLAAMLPFLRLSMDHVTRMGTRFTTRSEGLGDLEVGGSYTVYRVDGHRHRILLSAGVFFPVGSIHERDDTPAGPDIRLPYPMQLGSGTFDLHPGLAYLGTGETWAWGAETSAIIRAGKNSRGYRLGDELEFSAWATYGWAEWVSTSLRLQGDFWDDIHGADPALNPMTIPTADPDRRAGARVSVLPGLEFFVPRGFFRNQRTAVELGVPVFQSLDGPQLETDWWVSLGWQWVF